MSTPETNRMNAKQKRVSPELTEMVSMLSALEQRSVTSQQSPPKS